MKTRERFQAITQFRPFDRLPVIEWAEWWDKTIERWHGEGLPANLTDRYDICRHFGLSDIYKQDRIYPGGPAGGPGERSFIKSESDYDSLRPNLFPSNLMDPEKWTRMAAEQQEGSAVVWFSTPGPFWFPRTLFGIEQHLYAFYDHPELMRRMNADLAEWMLRMIERVCSFSVPDYVVISEDMSYNHGPMISKELFDEFLRPYYLRVIPRLKKHGIIPILDSDGNVTVLARWFEEVGMEGILPLERQAGVNIAKLREEHPKMKFIGHFDKMTMSKGEAAMRAEFERLLPTAAKGGFIVSCDHQTPPEVSYRDYRTYVALFREYADRAGRMSRKEE